MTMKTALGAGSGRPQVMAGMLLIVRDELTDGRVRHDLWAVKSARRLRSGDATVTLISATEKFQVEATARFPHGEVSDPWRLFELSEKDRELAWRARSGLTDTPRNARSVATLSCECENPNRDWYTGRDGFLHCEQCDGRNHA